MNEMTLYTVARKGQVAGVFTTEEAARACENAEVSRIRAPQLPGSPDGRGWVAAAWGEWTSMRMTAQGVQSQTVPCGPCWGVNVQTAVAGLFAPGGRLCMGYVPRDAALTDMRLYRLDHDYGMCCPENRMLTLFASCCMGQMRRTGAFSDETLGEDYIALYEREERRRSEMNERIASGLPELLAIHALGDACARAPGERGFCGTYLSRVAEGLERRIASHFTLQELRILGALLKLQDDLPVDLAAVPEKERQELRLCLEKLTPCVRRTTGIRCEDEDPMEIARWILHPELMEIDWSRIDIPDDADT